MKSPDQDLNNHSFSAGQNDRYARKHLRPIAKSVYQNNQVVRLNGSLNGAINTAGLNMQENSKALQGNMHQIAMTQTFNISILNNSFTNMAAQGGIQKPFMTQTLGQDNFDNSVSIGSPRAVRSIATESFAPFTVIPNAKIPDLSEQRKEEREERAQNLLKRPKHKSAVRDMANMSQQEKLMKAPLTMEDTCQFINLPLINTLRDNQQSIEQNSTFQARANTGEDEDGTKDEGPKVGIETVPNPPSFYYNDIEKWNAKFAKHIKERDLFKRQFARTGELTCLTKNTNIKEYDQQKAQTSRKGKKGGQSADPNEIVRPSLFNQVLKRRKSRQSNYAPGVLDFDYAGDSAKYQHLIEQRNDQGQPNKTQLNFEMKLRTYKNVTEYNANRAWCFPAVKQFSPRKQWDVRKKDTLLINAEYKKKFKDTFAEKNANELLHQFDKHGLNQSTMWQCSLRNLQRKEGFGAYGKKTESRSKSPEKKTRK